MTPSDRKRLGNDTSSSQGLSPRRPPRPSFLSATPAPRHEVCGREEPLGSVCVARARAVACGSPFGFPALLRS